MSSIPLPALDLHPVQQPDIMANYGHLLQLQNMAQTAPLQRQALQQQVQAGQLENQKAQIALKDQQGLSAAMQEWATPKQSAPPANMPQGMTGGPPTPSAVAPDYDSLLELARKHGVSFTAYQGLQQHILDMKEKAATIAKNAAQTGSDEANALKTKTAMLTDAMTGVANLPDDQLIPGLLSAAQELGQKGLLDPQHVQMAQQLAQTNDPATIRKTLGIQIAGMGGFTKMVEDAQKKLDVQRKQGESDPNSPFYNPTPTAVVLGTAPNAAAIQSGEIDLAARKAGAEAKARLPYSPPIVIQNLSKGAAGAPENQAPGGGTDWGKVAQRYGMTPGAFDQTAEKYFQTGQLPQIGRSPNAIAMNRDLMNRANDLHPGESLAENSAAFKASSDSLKKLQGNLDVITAFEGTANKNIDMLKSIAQKVPDMGVRFANVPVRMLSGSLIGTENMAAFKTALAPVQAEAAKILNSANLSGTLSDSSRHELQDIVDGNATYPALVASLNVLQQDFKNRHDSTQQTINDIQQRLKGSGASRTSGGSDPFAQFGGKAH